MASEIRVDKIPSLSGVGTDTPSSSGIDITGITTVATLKATTGIVTTLTATTGIVTTLTANTVTSLGAVSGTTGTFSGAVSGTTGTFTGDVDIADKIVHTGDTNTALRFPAADTVTVETGGSERFRVASDGQVRINCSAQPSATVSGYQFDSGGYNALRISQGGGTSGTDSSGVTVYGGGSNTNIGAAAAMGSTLNLINTNNTDNNQNSVDFSNSNSLSIAKVVGKNDSHSSRNGSLIFLTSSAAAPAERARITSSGRFGLNTNDPDTSFTIKSGGDAQMSLKNSSGTTKAYLGTDGAFGSAGTDDLRIRSDSSHIIFGFSGTEKVRMLSGGGITFNGDTTADNALDDYEEGGWTMTAYQGADSITQNAVNQRYTKIGNMVTVVGEVNGLTNTTNAVFTLAGLPYNVATGREGAGAAFSNSVTFPSGYNGITVYTYAGADRLRFYVSASGGGWHGVQGSEIGAGDIIFTASYLTS